MQVPGLVGTKKIVRLHGETRKPMTRSFASSRIATTPRAAPATMLASVTGKISTRAARVARQTFSDPSVAWTPTTPAFLNAGSSRTTIRPFRVDTGASAASENRRTLPPAVKAMPYGGATDDFQKLVDAPAFRRAFAPQ